MVLYFLWEDDDETQILFSPDEAGMPPVGKSLCLAAVRIDDAYAANLPTMLKNH